MLIMLPEFNSLCVCCAHLFLFLLERGSAALLASLGYIMHYLSLFKLNDEESLLRFGDCYWGFNQDRLLVRSGK